MRFADSNVLHVLHADQKGPGPGPHLRKLTASADDADQHAKEEEEERNRSHLDDGDPELFDEETATERGFPGCLVHDDPLSIQKLAAAPPRPTVTRRHRDKRFGARNAWRLRTSGILIRRGWQATWEFPIKYWFLMLGSL